MNGVAEVFREFPFTFGGALALSGAVSWLGAPWWTIAIAFVVGFFVGAAIDQSGKARARNRERV